MGRFNTVKYFVGAVTLVVATVIGCTRTAPPLTQPVNVFTPTSTYTAAFTSTNTYTSTITSTKTNSPTVTQTYTTTNTPTITNTPTVTNSPTFTTSPTNTLSPTDTLSPTITDTITNTMTPSVTTTVTNTTNATNTFTTTSTPGITLTPFGSLIPCASQPATFQLNYDFTNGIQCWTAKVDSGTNYITGFGTTNLVQYIGQSVLVVTVSNPTASPVTVAIDFIEATSVSEVLTGASVTAYAKLDSNLTVASSQAQIYTITGAPGYGYDDANNNWPAVTSSGWAQIIENGVGNANSQQLGVQVFNVAVPANSSGNIYLADVSLNVPPASTPTMTSTQTTTYTPGGNTPTVTMTPTSTTVSSGCTLTYDCQSLVGSSYSWAAGANAAISTSSTWHGTGGSQSIDCNVTAGNTWCKIATINSFFPISTAGMTQIIVNVDVDASMVTGNGGWDQLVLQTNAGGTLASAAIGLATGPQSVTFTISGAPATINDYEFIYQSGGTPTGNVYFGDVQVVFTGACPAPTIPTYIQGWTFEGNSLTDTIGTWVTIGGTDLGTNLLVTQPGDLSTYCADVTATFTAANQTAGIIMVPTTPINGSSFTGIRANFWIDSSCAPGDYPGGEIQLGDGTNFPENGWTNVTMGGWTTITYPVASWGTFNTASISMIKVFVNLGGASAFGAGHVKFDNIEFY